MNLSPLKMLDRKCYQEHGNYLRWHLKQINGDELPSEKYKSYDKLRHREFSYELTPNVWEVSN